jgi:hypothetical protein
MGNIDAGSANDPSRGSLHALSAEARVVVDMPCFGFSRARGFHRW